MEEFFDVDENHATAAASTAPQDINHHSNVDTSRPFRSVKEAVSIFGERILVGEVYSSKAFAFPKEETPIFSPSQKVYKEPWSNYNTSRDLNSFSNYNEVTLSDTVKKLETELEETKAELKLLKEKESDTEVALASLNAELHSNMSKLQAAQAAGQMEVAFSRSRGEDIIDDIIEVELEKKMENAGSRNLAQILSVGQQEGNLFVGKKKDKIKVMKKKPIIPLVGGLFSWKKRSSTSMHNPLYASSHLHWN